MQNDELNFPCPKCNHKSFYFNKVKLIGHCFRASCGWSPTLKELLKFSGPALGPIFSGNSSPFTNKSDLSGTESVISLPANSVPIIEKKAGIMETAFPEAVDAIQDRGVKVEDILRFNFHIDYYRVYIPVYEDGKLVQWVGRLIWWNERRGIRYKYATGAKISNFLFNWDEMRTKDYLTLVENTFNSLWLSKVNATSTFGSSLSRSQIEKIAKSNAKKVYLLWDEGSEKSGKKAVERLRKMGVNSYQILISGQPDSHSLSSIENTIRLVCTQNGL